METAVVMKRELFGNEISQNSKTGMFSATDLVRAGNKFRMLNDLPAFDDKAWFKYKGTLEFMAEIERRHGQVKISARGRGKHTWIHPLLFIDMALTISPKLKIEVYEWMFDHLIKESNNSGDSYKEMCGRLFVRHGDKREFGRYVSGIAQKIRIACGVSDWQTATEDQLKHRDQMHHDIALLADAMNNNDQAVNIVLRKHAEQKIVKYGGV